MKHITTVILLINGLLLSSIVQGQNQQNGSKKRKSGAPNSVRNQNQSQSKGQESRQKARKPLGSANQQNKKGKKPQQKPQGPQTGMTKAKKGESIVKALKLDKEQVEKLRAAHQSMVATHKGIRGNKDLSDEEKKQAHHGARKKHLEGLAEFLSEEQLAKLKEIHRKNAKPQQNNKKPKPGERLAKALGLSKEQESKLRRVREFATKKIGGIQKNKELSKEQKQEAIKKVHVTFRARKKEILTEEQQAKLKELHAAAKARREEQASKSGKESSGRPKSHLVRTAQKRSENQNKQRGAQNEQHSKNGNQAFGRQQNQQQERQANQPKIKLTHADIVYGPYQSNRLDLWLAKSGKPTPLLVCIHGGGFVGGDKSSYHRNARLINAMHAAGISVAAINYRLLKAGKNHYPAAMHDGARALQFLRHNAKRFNIDAKRFGATGGSAGGCMLMWLGFRDDLADPKSDDPVSRQSTRLLALAPNVGQSCVHLPTLLEWFKVESLIEFPTSRAFFNYPPGKEVVITDELDRTMRDASPIFHLSKDDPPCYMTFGANVTVTASSNPGLWVHHPIMGFKLKEAMDKRGLECHVQYKEGPVVKGYRDQNDFLIKKLTGK